MKASLPFKIAIACAALSAAPWAAADTCFFVDYNYSGASYCSAALEGDISAPVIDKVSAVRVPAGYKIVLYQRPQFGGKTLELTADAPNLSNLGFNNLTSSFKLVATGATPPTDPQPGAKQIVFIGNSFFHGHFEPTLHYNAANVVDLNGTGYGGVPGIFKQLTVDAGLNYATHIEAVSSQTLEFHYTNKLAEIGSKAWDVVVMGEYSTLDKDRPGDPAKLIKYSKLIEQYVHGGSNTRANANAKVYLLQTWPRADQLYNTPGGHWSGRTVEQMGEDLRAAYAEAALQDNAISGVVPVGDSFVRAIVDGVADRNPYDGIDAGKVSVWNTDNYHASGFGSYLEACVLFGKITGLDPRTLGANSVAARDLGLSPAQASSAQSVAFAQLSSTSAR